MAAVGATGALLRHPKSMPQTAPRTPNRVTCHLAHNRALQRTARRASVPPPLCAAAAAGAGAGAGAGAAQGTGDPGGGGGRSRGRHPDLRGSLAGSSGGSSNSSSSSSSSTTGSVVAVATASPAPEQPRAEEVDERYRRADYSEVYIYESRQAFARCIAGGEPRMRLAEAALHVTAEDDAIASLSTVRFPVNAWLDRIERLVDQLCAVNLSRAATASLTTTAATAAGASAGDNEDATAAATAANAASILRVAERYLFEEVGFRSPDYGRSNLPEKCVVDHAGVWEDARLGYLHETLVRRMGHPAALGLLLGEVCSRLLARGVLPCAAAIDTRGFMLPPRAVPLPHLTRDVLLGVGAPTGGGDDDGDVRGGGGPLVGLNTCTSEVLVELLRHLKRSYWPFAWDSGVDESYPAAVGSHGGFRSAAKAASGEEMSAALAAIGKVAAWRLERGIWTSPGAGDIRRARAASERLVLLASERCPEERRDLAVLLLHCGELGAARLELRTYLRAVTAAAVGKPSSSAATAAGAFGGGGSGQEGPDPFDVALCRRLLVMLEGLGSSSIEGGVLEEPEEPLSVEVTLRAPPPWERAGGATSKRPLPLTW